MTNRKIPATELDRTKFKKYKLPKAYQEELLKTASFCIICISDGSVDSNRDAFQELAAISLLIENFFNRSLPPPKKASAKTTHPR